MTYSLLLILFFHLFGDIDHFVDLILGETSGWLDDDRLILAGSLVFGSDLQDAVVVDLEAHSDLWSSSKI
jgi:hypothetical protein